MTATDLQPRVEETRIPVATLRERTQVAGPPRAVRWPWVVAGAAAVVGGLALVSFLAMGWRLGTSAGTAAQDPGHLAALVQGVQNILVLGIAAALGVGAMQRTAAAVRLAAQHKVEADLQSAAALQHYEAATQNLELADARARQLAEVQQVLDEVVTHAEHRSCDNSRFVTDLQACDVPADPADPHQYRHLLVRSDTFSRVDPELAQLADRARSMLRELRSSRDTQ